MPGKPSDNDDPLWDAGWDEEDENEGEYVGCREVAEDFLGCIVILFAFVVLLVS